MMPFSLLDRLPPGPRLAAAILAMATAACQPTVKVEAPDKPIEINLNIRIEQEVRVRVERDLEKVFSEDPDLFGLPEGAVK
jgi:YnbE-like lipoprotein